jgi:type II secretory pathway component PulJ
MVHWTWLISTLIAGGAFGFLFCSMIASFRVRNLEKENTHLRNQLQGIYRESCGLRTPTANGFTLIELLVSVFIAMIILGAMLNFFINQSRSYASNEVTLTTLQDVRSSVSTMVTDLRLAGYKPSTSSFCGIVQATDKSVQVVSDLNQNGNTSDDEEDIAYAWNPDTKELTKNGVMFLDNVQSLSFQYTLRDNSVTSLPADLTLIRKITLSISIQSRNVDPLTRKPKIFSLVSDITPRNLGL